MQYKKQPAPRLLHYVISIVFYLMLLFFYAHK